jgi:glyoxylase-like metal-dependent hydrolase (beta-lactamase superfamily II)
MSGLADLAEARRVEGASRLARLRDAAESIGDELRRTPVRSVTPIPIDRLVVETRTVLPDARLVSPLVGLERRALLVVAADGRRVLVDPSDAGPCTPYEERIASRHPVVHRALATRPSDPGWPDADLVVSTSLALRSIVRARATMPKVRWIVPRAELDAAREPSPLDLPRYARETPELDAIPHSRELAPGVVLVETPGPTPGHASIAFALHGKVFVHTHAGAVVDAWAPYESTLPGLREAVRLRNVEAVIRGDASDPVRALEAMAIERALADRRADRPAFFRTLPAMELVPKAFMPRLRPLASSLDP